MSRGPRVWPEVLNALLGDHLVLARPGPQPGQRLQVLDPLAAWVWQSARSGLGDAAIAALLSDHFGRPLAQVQADVAALLAGWEEAAPTVWTVCLADRRIAVRVDDPDLADRLGALLPPPAGASARAPDTCLYLAGTANDWHLAVDERIVTTGRTLADALLSSRAALLAAGSDAPRRLIVPHAAGVSRAGQGVLLIGAGGAGKSTLATALNADGWDWLGDDAIAVTLEGQLLGLGLGPCLRAGSWPALAPWMPGLEQVPVVPRRPEPVRLPSPPGPCEAGPVPTAAFLVIRYRPGERPALEPLAPVAVLQAMLAAEAVLPVLDQARLEALTRWIAAAPGFTLTYPDLSAALDLAAGLGIGEA
jgi:hypothetical protein